MGNTVFPMMGQRSNFLELEMLLLSMSSYHSYNHSRFCTGVTGKRKRRSSHWVIERNRNKITFVNLFIQNYKNEIKDRSSTLKNINHQRNTQDTTAVNLLKIQVTWLLMVSESLSWHKQC